ncbi:RhoGAP-domain-containing protein [Ascodesmis nigricans]|uniref:RhoGAP-domain-containing protein n=1 Tax=Ascodesmis nigricans TaxID=341454 RepID=A0A4S2MK35_9PEZI|nr:RhoGAP-domain-containing protein [Ascodesmis nigricans]
MDKYDHMQESEYMDEDDLSVPCKGCGHILEEGKAFELAGNRWHIDCFRCNSCHSLLDSEANLLLLGDGSLICNDCTYSCTACNNKIEDLAILTGDQAFCAGCFRCRNCKRKIENLKYARTSQGIFCMSCHETLMARRKKRQRPAGTTSRTPQAGNSTAPSPMLALDKSLPSLPPELAASQDHGSQANASRQRPENYRTNTSGSLPRNDQLSPSHQSYGDRLAPRSYNSHQRNSYQSQPSETSVEPGRDQQESYSFIPLVLDHVSDHEPAPLPSTTYNRPGISREQSYEGSFNSYQRSTDSLPNSRPVYERKQSDSSSMSQYDPNRDRTPRPHIASLDKSNEAHSGLGIDHLGYGLDSEYRDRYTSDAGSKHTTPMASREPSRSRQTEYARNEEHNGSSTVVEQRPSEKKDNKSEAFKLGDVPKERKRSHIPQPRSPPPPPPAQSTAARSDKVFTAGSLPRSDSIRGHRPRGKSPAVVPRKPIMESDTSFTSTSSSERSQSSHTLSSSSGSTTVDSQESNGVTKDSQQTGIQLSSTTTVSNIHHETHPPSNRSSPKLPRDAPPHRPTASQSSNLSISETMSQSSPALPPLRSPVGGLIFDEELRRVFGGSTPIVPPIMTPTATPTATPVAPVPPSSSGKESIGRRLSNTVKHGRSLSEAARMSPKWSRPGSSGVAPQGEISSPITPDSKEDVAVLKQELRRSTQRIAELEAKLNNAQAAKALENNIQEKRMTVASLETERETVLRELLVIKERIDGAKESGKPIDFDQLKSDLISGLTRELEDLKGSLKAEIQQLVADRDRLMDDVETFGRLREQAIQDTEQLNMKNAQLADLNNELTRRIQGTMVQNHKKQPSGLGIYDPNDMASILSGDGKGPIVAVASQAVTHLEHGADGQVYVAEKVYKGGAQQKKFFWKKPAVTMLKGAGKGFNRVFQSENPHLGEGQGAYENYSSAQPSQQRATTSDGQVGKTEKGSKWRKVKNVNGAVHGVSGPEVSGNGGPPIFGGELDARVEYEGTSIPNVVMKCIQEVEIRGMDMEGIYRKSGGATQMREIQDQFERGIDVQFDPELDICSVTSVLKQYFRNLPNPLITYEVYDRFIETTGMKDKDTRVKALKDIVDDLPPSHKIVLQFVIFHLARVAGRNAENLMTTRNLSVVFAPTLIRHVSDEREMSDMHLKNSALQFLIDHNEEVF